MTLKYASKWKLLVFAVFAAAKAMQAVLSHMSSKNLLILPEIPRGVYYN